MSGSRKYMAANDATAAKNGGGKHWTKAERQLRIATEVRPDPAVTAKKVMAPKWLTDAALRKEFYELSKILSGLGVGFCASDADFLGLYLTTKQEYLAASRHVRLALNSGDGKAAKTWTGTRDKLFSECRACANELGLTISSRCKLVAPEPKVEQENPLELLKRKYMEA